MPAPATFNLPTYGSAPNQYSTEQALEAAVQAFVDEVYDAFQTNTAKSFHTRAAAVSAGQAALPNTLGMIATREGDYIVYRAPGLTADDPLFATAPRWGVMLRVPSAALLDDKADVAELTAEAAQREAADDALALGLDAEAQSRVEGDEASIELATVGAMQDAEFHSGPEDRQFTPLMINGEAYALVDQDARFLLPGEAEFHGYDEGWQAALTTGDNTLIRVDGTGQVVPAVDSEFHGYADDWSYVLAAGDRALMLIDADGNPIGSGGPSAGSPLIGYVDGTDLRAVGATDEVAAPLGSYQALALDGGSPASVRAIIDWPALGPSRVVAAGAGLLVPDQQQVLHVMIGLGQSLMVGSTSASSLVSTEQNWPDWVMMFRRGDGLSDVRMGLVTSDGDGAPALDPDDLIGFEPLVARVGQGAGSRGETPIEALCRALQAQAKALNARHRMLAFTAAMGGTPYNSLKKGTQTYTNMLLALQRAQALAEAQGWRVIVDGCVVRHGEGDATSNIYDQMLTEWQSDVDDDVKAITGQDATVKFVVAQTSSFSGPGNASRRMLDAHNANPHINLCGPDYPFADLYHTDFVHMTGPGYFVSGEYLARAWRQVLWSSQGKSSITQMLSATRTGTSVVIDYEVPVAPLVIDTVTVPERDVAGFRYQDSTGSIAIASAAVTGPAQITLTLASAPSGTSEQVLYASLGHDGTPREEATIPRGNVRDSAPDISLFDGRPLRNWACHQDITVTVN